MKHLLILAAAAFLAVGCHQRTEDEAGAAPDQGDAAVTATDTAAVQTDTTTAAMPADTTAVTSDTTAVTSDTTAVSGETTTVGVDSVGAQGEVQAADTTAWADSTAVEAPADTTKY
jgi:hypothetical protein